MSTEHERALNREKQRRFKARHPGYDTAHKQRTQAKKHVRRAQEDVATGDYRTFELADPRDPESLPLVVACGNAEIDPIWARMWRVKDISHSRWAAWLRELAQIGLQPRIRLSPWDVGVPCPVPVQIARLAVVSRIRRISQLVTGDATKLPDWLLRTFEGSVRTPIGALTPGGQVFRFPTVGAACRDLRLMALVVRNRVACLDSDRNGWIWFDD